jgi:lipid A 4'-phosphatase
LTVAQTMLLGAFVAGFAAAIFFFLFPGIDLQIARHFYVGERHFIGGTETALRALRLAFNVLFDGTCALTALGLIVTRNGRRAWLNLTQQKWLYLALCLLVGPLVVTNLGLKDHWGRARPRDVIEFGGDKAFTPPLTPSLQCEYNCSFVSGEASSAYIVFFAAAFLFSANALFLILLGIVMGSLAGFVRMTEGGHFLSDVVFAGILMAVTAAAIQMLFDELTSARRDKRALSDGGSLS